MRGEGERHEHRVLLALLPEGLHERVRFLPLGGQDDFRDQIIGVSQATPLTSGEVRTLVVVRDAESHPGAMLQSTRDSLNAAGFADIPAENGEIVTGSQNIGIFIVSKSDGTGMLEDLFLASIRGRPDYACLEDYCACVRERGGREPRNPSKARLRAWLAMEADFDMGVGVALRREHFDIRHAAFDDLRDFLRRIEAV